MSAPVTARTRVLGLLGDPVSHSRSPLIQNAAIRALGLDGVYVALRCGARELPGLLRGLAHAGGGGNVTIPHKEAAYEAVDRCTDAAEATGACNTFWLADGEVWGDNTDVAGFSAALRLLLGRSISGGRALVIGAGGGARAVVHTLASHGAERIVIVNRTVVGGARLGLNRRHPDGWRSTWDTGTKCPGVLRPTFLGHLGEPRGCVRRFRHVTCSVTPSAYTGGI